MGGGAIFADSKSRAQELSNDVSFVIFGHQTWDLEEGVGVNLTPQHIPWLSSTPAGIGLINLYLSLLSSLIISILINLNKFLMNIYIYLTGQLIEQLIEQLFEQLTDLP